MTSGLAATDGRRSDAGRGNPRAQGPMVQSLVHPRPLFLLGGAYRTDAKAKFAKRSGPRRTRREITFVTRWPPRTDRQARRGDRTRRTGPPILRRAFPSPPPRA